MRWITTLAAIVAAAGLGAAQSPGGSKVCVYEPKATTKTVYTTVCKEYCAPNYSPLAILRRCCGITDCDGPCAEPLTRRVLVKKSVSGPDTMVCTLKELPLVCLPGTVPPAAVLPGVPGQPVPVSPLPPPMLPQSK
jgi:hypothetical protein